jgi:hypothetical protein
MKDKSVVYNLSFLFALLTISAPALSRAQGAGAMDSKGIPTTLETLRPKIKGKGASGREEGSTEPITLKVYLMGLEALVPTKQDQGLTVLLQRTPSGHTFHLPVLVWDPAVVTAMVTQDGVPVNDQGDDIRDRLTVKGATGLVLDGEEISVEGTKRGKVRVNDHPGRPWYTPFVGAIPTDSEKLASTAWIPKINDVSRQVGPVKADVFNSPDPQKVAALLHISADASLAAVRLAGSTEDAFNFTFKKSGDDHPLFGHRGAIADVAVLEVPVDAAEVTVTLRAFGSTSNRAHERRIVLTPVAGARSIDLLLGNLTPLAQNIKIVGAPVEHFALYYELTQNEGNAPKRIPFAGRNKKRGSEKIPKVISSVSEPCDPAKGGVCRPICGLVMLQEPN